MRNVESLVLASCVVVAASVAACHPSAASRPPVEPVVAKERAHAFGPEDVDAALREAWKRAGVVPAPRADDATFLRRVTLDVTGTIPTPEAVTAFLESRDPDKRKKVVEALVASPAYAEHWATYWDDVLMGRGRMGAAVDRAAFHEWLKSAFAAHTPWDRVVRDLVAATGRNSAIGDEGESAPVNGAVNWTLRFRDAPQDLAGNASRVFLGVQIQCAQCHDHKTEAWKQDDFRSFASAFLRARVEQVSPKTMGTKQLVLSDEEKVPPRLAKNADLAPVAKARPRGLDGTDLEAGKDTRRSLATWMTSPENPWFAKAIVNRMWGHFLGRGFTDPVDDVRPSNPVVLPEVLDALAKDFVAHGFDLGHLVKTICATEAYQLSASAAAKPDPENKLWARFHLVPLGAEEMLNAVVRATRIEDAAQKAGVQRTEQLRAQLDKQMGFLFDVDEEDDTPDYEGTVSQVLALVNGNLVGNGSRAVPGSAVAQVLASSASDEEKIEKLALQILSRKPNELERSLWLAYVSDPSRPRAPAPNAPGPRGNPKRGGGGPLARLDGKPTATDPKRAAYEDLVWAWLNSSEFTFNH